MSSNKNLNKVKSLKQYLILQSLANNSYEENCEIIDRLKTLTKKCGHPKYMIVDEGKLLEYTVYCCKCGIEICECEVFDDMCYKCVKNDFETCDIYFKGTAIDGRYMMACDIACGGIFLYGCYFCDNKNDIKTGSISFKEFKKINNKYYSSYISK